MSRSNISLILKLALIIEATALLVAAATISRNYQDSWILEGLEIPFAVFMGTYAIYFLVEDKITWMIPFALICRSVILLVPNLKYEWFQGVAVDQHMHFRMAQDILNVGYIPTDRLYSETPNMHLSFVIYSFITDVPLLHSFKYLPILCWLVYPLVVYLIMKESRFTENSSVLKYAIFISSIPVKSSAGSYLVIGTLFGLILSSLLLWQLIKVLQKNDRRDLIISIICILALVATHTFSSIMMMVALITTYLIVSLLRERKLLNFKKLSYAPIITLLPLIVLINSVWLTHKAMNLLTRIIETEIPYVERLMGFEAVAETSIPPRFFELSFMDALKTTLVFHGADILLLFLTLIGIGIVFITKFETRWKPALMFLSLFLVSLWLFLAIGVLVFNFGEGWYDRIIRFSVTISPIFSSISIFYISKRIRYTKTLFVIFLIVLATIEHYNYQPLMPPASTISKDLPKDEPIVYVVTVNSAYQRYMIMYAERYISQGAIACDKVTQDQIIGLTNLTFSRARLARYYPFSRLIGVWLGKNVAEKEYDYFLIHLPGKSGAFHDEAEIRTRSLVVGAITSSNVIYTNGESYTLIGQIMMFNSSM